MPPKSSKSSKSTKNRKLTEFFKKKDDTPTTPRIRKQERPPVIQSTIDINYTRTPVIHRTSDALKLSSEDDLIKSVVDQPVSTKRRKLKRSSSVDDLLKDYPKSPSKDKENESHKTPSAKKPQEHQVLEPMKMETSLDTLVQSSDGEQKLMESPKNETPRPSRSQTNIPSSSPDRLVTPVQSQLETPKQKLEMKKTTSFTSTKVSTLTHLPASSTKSQDEQEFKDIFEISPIRMDPQTDIVLEEESDDEFLLATKVPRQQRQIKEKPLADAFKSDFNGLDKILRTVAKSNQRAKMYRATSDVVSTDAREMKKSSLIDTFRESLESLPPVEEEVVYEFKRRLFPQKRVFEMPVDLQQYGSLETILSLRIVTKLSQFREIPESWIEYLFAMMVTSTDVFVIQATQSELLHLTNRLDLKWHKIQEWMHITGVDQENTETDNLEPERNLEALLEVGTQMMDSETNINESGQMIFVSLVRFLSSLEAGSITASLCRFMSKIANHCTDDEWRSIHSECLEIQYPDLFECYRVIHHFQAHNERMDALRIEMAKRSLGIDDPLQYITLLKDQTLDYPTVLTQMRMYTAFMTKKVIENKVLGLTRETGTRVAKNTCLYSRQDR